MIIRCPANCQDTFQDTRYNGKRVYTEPGSKGSDGHKCRCTNCGNVITYGEAKKRV
jgi:hypothetical protein